MFSCLVGSVNDMENVPNSSVGIRCYKVISNFLIGEMKQIA